MPVPVDNPMVTKANVHIDQIIKTPQFWQTWTVFTCVTTAGMGVISMAKTLMGNLFASQLPLIVTSSFCASYVMALSAANLGGRVGWAAVSDRIGRKPVFMLLTAGSVPLYLSIPYCVDALVSDPSVVPLYTFYGSTMLLFSFFGAAYACLPPFEADLFGSKYVGAAHGFMLTGSSAGAMIGPSALAYA
eukprot:UC1_evm1s927